MYYYRLLTVVYSHSKSLSLAEKETPGSDQLMLIRALYNLSFYQYRRALMPDSPDFNRYAAKLLFQYRVEYDGVSNKMRDTEVRIIVLNPPSAKAAYAEAMQVGADDQTTYVNDSDGTVNIEFVGILDLMHLGAECTEETVWYEIKTMLCPQERKNTLIPPPEKLDAIRQELSSKQEI